MHAQEVAIHEQSHNLSATSLPDFQSSFAEHTSPAAAVYSDEVPLLAARLSNARRRQVLLSDDGLPQREHLRMGMHKPPRAPAEEG